MRAHVIEVGPSVIRRLCCGGGTVINSETERAAVESIDDQVALIDDRVVTVVSLWADVLGAVDCGASEQMLLVHPSWWSPARVEVVRCAGEALAGVAEIRPRTWLLARAAASKSGLTAAIVEIAEDFVVITGDAVIAESRRGDVAAVAEAVGAAIRAMATGVTDTVVIDAPATVCGAATLAAAIAKTISGACDATVMLVDDIGLRKLVGELKPRARTEAAGGSKPWVRARHALTLVVLVIGLVLGFGAARRQAEQHPARNFPTTFAVEGHVALEVPAEWLMRRVLTGPGSARVQITSPTDPEVALHVTQSRVTGSLNATAEFLKSAIDVAPAGVFVDFDPADRNAGRPAVTYREIRAEHVIRWIVWVDQAIRISIGCQSRSGRDDAVRRACDLAVRSARVLDRNCWEPDRAGASLICRWRAWAATVV